MPPPLDHILLIEDDPDIQTVARLVLETIGGFRLSACGSGRDAVAQAETLAPDLVLLDVMMPGMDGPTTLEALRRLPSLASTPVVFMTARAQPDEVARYRSLGVADVIVKPFEPTHLCDQIRDIWQRTHAAADGA